MNQHKTDTMTNIFCKLGIHDIEKYTKHTGKGEWRGPDTCCEKVEHGFWCKNCLKKIKPNAKKKNNQIW